MDQVDEDGSGQIEFREFLHIIKKASYERSKRAKSKLLDAHTTTTSVTLIS